MIFLESMSVKAQTVHLLRQELSLLSQTIHSELSNYRTLLLTLPVSIAKFVPSALNDCLSCSQGKSGLQMQIQQLKEDNSKLRNKHMATLVYQQELERVRELLVRENGEKEERVKELAWEVETIRSYMQELKQLHSQDPIIDFDDNEQIDNSILPEGLEVIKEVSEHDLSITMSLQSLQSFKSDTLEDQPNPSMHHPTSITPADHDSENRPGAGNCLVGDYQDALEILKNYNSGNGAVMSKRVGTEATHTEGRIRVGNILVDRDIQEPPVPEPRKGRNDTMSKLKKMRKIEDLDIQSRISLPSKRSNLIPHHPDQPHQSQTHSTLTPQQLSHQSLNDRETDNSLTTLHSNGFKSNSNDENFSLEEAVRTVNDLLRSVALRLAHPTRIERIKATLHKIDYDGGFEFQGHCDETKKPTGYGKLTLNGETVYQGEWRMGRFHGWGKLVLLGFPQARKERAIIEVDGNFRGGEMEGTTLCLFNSGERFMGAMREGSIEREGTFVGEKGILTGHWENNRLLFLI